MTEAILRLVFALCRAGGATVVTLPTSALLDSSDLRALTLSEVSFPVEVLHAER